jgi:predicted nucleic acid-binding protein
MLSASKALEIREAVLADPDSGSFFRIDLSPLVHRQAESLMFQVESVALRTLDALRVALALHRSATHIATFDVRMRAAALHAGLKAVDLQA